jgi:mRNA interferase MazF
MRRGELYRVRRPAGDPKPARVFVVVSRQPLIDSTYSTVICAPVFTQFHGLPSQVAVSTPEGLKHASAIQCDGLMSLEKSRLTDYVGELAAEKMRELDVALTVAVGLPTSSRAPIEPG